MSPAKSLQNGFAELGLLDELLTALTELGYEEPTPIQRETIPRLIEGNDLIGQAATGTGKTAAFALPILQRLAASRDGREKQPGAIVLVPTRELAMQVSEALHRYGRGFGTRVVPIFGGQPIVRQLQTLKRGVDVVVATPGRAIDHINRGSLNLDSIQMVVLDEADEMFDMGFAEDIETILASTPVPHQTVLFSATMPARIKKVAKVHLNNPIHVEIERAPEDATARPKVRQTAYIVPRAHKPAALGRILDIESPGATLVFCRTRIEVDDLTQTLNGRGYRAEAIHGGMSQEQRDRVMKRIRKETSDLLVATDVAARGLDIDHLTHVINYDVPSAPESYVHRIGRVGRAGREGIAITLAEPREHRMLKNIERLTKQKIDIDKVPTVTDLRARRMDLTRATIRECILEGQLDPFRVVVDTLADEFDIVEVALAAVKLAFDTSGSESDDADIPNVDVERERDFGKSARNTSARASSGRDRERPSRDRESSGDRDRGSRSRDDREPRAVVKGRKDRDERPAGKGRPRSSSGDTVRLFVGAGRALGIRPQDLVGAIANESDVRGRDIGAIEIADRFSLVEVPADRADDVIATLRGTRIKGNKVTVRLEK